MTSIEALGSLRPALRQLVRFDRSKITYATAFRNAVGVFVPLALGAGTGHLAVGLGASIGALNVCFSDRPGPYGLRAGRMLLVCMFGALSALVGGLAGSIDWLTIALVALWAFAGGMLVVFGPVPEQIGLTSILLLVIYGGFGLAPHDVLLQTGFIVGGGLLQTGLSVVAWPFRQFGPERQALAAVFRKLASVTQAPPGSEDAPPVTAEITTARTTLTGLGSAHSGAAEAFRVLLDEAERVRLELLALQQLRADLVDEALESLLAPCFDGLWTASAQLLEWLATAITRDDPAVDGAELLQQARQSAGSMRRVMDESGRGNPILDEILGHVEALLGQLNACLEIVSSGSVTDAEPGRGARASDSLRHRLAESIAVIRANLTVHSTSFRHALRIAVTLAIATALARQLGVDRSYWVPLTVAIVLKPDFTSTFTRGVLRIVGTMIGLGLSTLLVHVVFGELAGRIVFAGLLVFFVRSVGPANFGVSAIAVTGLVVILTSFVGASVESTIHDRAVDTVIGGLLSLAAYVLWPSWERMRTQSVLADMLDVYRQYFDMVMAAYRGPGHLNRPELERLRLEARLARSNAEASVDRMSSEPVGRGEDLDVVQGILASSHRFVRSVMTIEASLYTPTEPVVPRGLEQFIRDVDSTLDVLSASLRRPATPTGAQGPGVEAPADLRKDQSTLVESIASPGRPTPPLLIETERITNSLNTMLDLMRRAGAHPVSRPGVLHRRRGVKHSA